MQKTVNTIVKTDKVLQNKKKAKDNNSLKRLINIELKSTKMAVDLGQMFTYIITVKNESNSELFDVNIIQKISQNLRILDVTTEYINIKNVDKDNKIIIFDLNVIKPKEIKIIEVEAEVINQENKNIIRSEVKLEGSYINNKQKNDIRVKSNICNINMVIPKLVLKMKSSVLEAVVGEIVRFKILIENRGNTDLNNVVIRDILKPELKFLDNTIKVDEISMSNESILSGVNIGELKEGCNKEIVFDVNVLSRPENGKLTNISTGQYQYNIQEENRRREGSSISNENNILIQLASIKINKTADKENISLDDEITYTIDMENDGTLEIKNIVFNEQISDVLTLIEGHFAIDGQIVNNINISKGILIGDLNVYEKRTITYKVKYNKANECGKIVNVSKVNFDYKQTNGLIFKGKELEKELEISSTISTFKYISKSEKIYKEKDKPYIGDVDNISVDIDIIEYHIIKTIQGKSNEGQILTGYKIILQGLIKQIVEYSSDECNKLVYTISQHIPFSTFLVLPKNFKLGSKINIDYEIEDISFRKRDKESIYTNTCLFLIAKVQSYDPI